MKLVKILYSLALAIILLSTAEARKIKKTGKKDPNGKSTEPVEESKEPERPARAKPNRNLGLKIDTGVESIGDHNYDASKKELMEMKSDESFLTEKGIIIDKQIGYGAFGNVYKVRKRNTEMAVKIVLLKEGDVPQKEMSMLKAVEGVKHVTELREFLNQGNREYYLFDLYEGNLTSYFHFRNKETKESIDWKNVLRQILEGLKGIHGKGIMHLDIKPENIMVKGSDLFIGDFGIAENISKSSNQGTNKFKAVEQNIGKAEAKSDIWALGNTLIWLCTKKTLVTHIYQKEREENKDALEVILHTMESHPEEAKKALGEIFEEIEAKSKENDGLNIPNKDLILFKELLEKMMVPNPNGRASAEELLNLLGEPK